MWPVDRVVINNWGLAVFDLLAHQDLVLNLYLILQIIQPSIVLSGLVARSLRLWGHHELILW